MHLGHIVLGNQKVRQTKKQIEEDNAHAKATAIAQREDKVGHNKCIVEVEDAIERDKEQVCMYANRPDLCCKETPRITEEEEV
jgi:hypothetical protein